jgi:hypothetical protein
VHACIYECVYRMCVYAECYRVCVYTHTCMHGCDAYTYIFWGHAAVQLVKKLTKNGTYVYHAHTHTCQVVQDNISHVIGVGLCVRGPGCCFLSMFECMHTHTHAHTHTCTHTHACNTHMHTHMSYINKDSAHIHTHTHMHAAR